MTKTLLFTFYLLLANAIAYSQTLQATIQSIVKDKKAQIGVAVTHIESGEEVFYNGDKFFAMQSTYKFPIGLAVLGHMQKNLITLDHKVNLTKQDLLENTWSPIRDKYPDGKANILITELIAEMVSWSDNNACDYVLRWIGGPSVAQQYIEALGIGNMHILTNEETMQGDWNIQYLNNSTPIAFNNLLVKAFRNPPLKKEYHDFIWKIMLETATGKNRIKGLLPKETPVYHKTGTSAVTSYGLAGAVNDAGIIELPNKKHIAITVFVNNSLESESINEQIIAQISAAAYTYFSNK